MTSKAFAFAAARPRHIHTSYAIVLDNSILALEKVTRDTIEVYRFLAKTCSE